MKIHLFPKATTKLVASAFVIFPSMNIKMCLLDINSNNKGTLQSESCHIHLYKLSTKLYGGKVENEKKKTKRKRALILSHCVENKGKVKEEN